MRLLSGLRRIAVRTSNSTHLSPRNTFSPLLLSSYPQLLAPSRLPLAPPKSFIAQKRISSVFDQSYIPFSHTSVGKALSRYTPRSGGGGGSAGGRGPRWSKWKRRIDSVPSNYILYGLIGSNVAVYLTWQYGWAMWNSPTYRNPALILWLRNNFVVSVRNIQSGRIWTIVTAAFSHEGTTHILLNLFALYSIATPVMAMLGNTGFLALYLFSGVMASTTSLLSSAFLVNRSANYGSHGASGAVLGCLSFFAACYPRATFLVFFVVPAPAWLCVGGIFAYDLYSSFGRPHGTVDSAGHVGGLLAGLFWFMKMTGRLR